MESNPRDALQLLGRVNPELLTDKELAYAVLVQVRAAELTGANIQYLDEAVKQSYKLFSRDNSAPQAAFACYVLGRVHEAQENMEEAQQAYLLADEWAEKANSQLPNSLYSAIPYNIASLYARSGQYDESLRYLEKAFQHMEVEKGSYRDKLYALELKGLNLKNLEKTDASLRCYDEALTIALRQNDTIARNRILYNKYVLLYSTKDYKLAEEKCKEVLPLATASGDSLHLGLLNLSLARVYAGSNKIDSALLSIHQAERLLQNSDSRIRLMLYKRLYTVEQRAGNSAKANLYKQRLDAYTAQQDSQRKAEQEALALAQQVIAKKEADEYPAKMLQQLIDYRNQRKQARETRLLYICLAAYNLVAIGVLVGWLWLKLRNRRREKAASLSVKRQRSK